MGWGQKVKYHNHTLHTNPWHREEEQQNIYSNNTYAVILYHGLSLTKIGRGLLGDATVQYGDYGHCGYIKVYILYSSVCIIKIGKKTKIRNRYNQLLYLTEEAKRESDKKHKKTSHTRKLRGQPFPSRRPRGYNKQMPQYGNNRTCAP